MFPIEAFESTLAKVADLFRQHEIRFHITGGITSVAYGDPRMTQDLDVVIDNRRPAEAADLFIASLSASDFLFDEPALREAVRERGQFQLYDETECLKVDVYPRELIPGELDRSVEEEVFPGRRYPLVSHADAALSKLLWVSKGSHKSRRDLRYLYSNADAASREVIDRIAGELNQSALLAEVLAEPDELPP